MIETEQTSFLLNRTSAEFRICEKCKGESLMITPEKIAEVTDWKTRDIYKIIEMNKVHFVEFEKVFVCLKNLFNGES